MLQFNRPKLIFFIDPMSYSNLEYYDKGLLSNFPTSDVVFIGNIKIGTPPKNIKSKLIYTYSDKRFIFKLLSYFISNFKLLFLVFYYNPKLLHFQWFKLPFLDFYFLKLIKLIKPNMKVVFTAHNILPHDTGNKFRSIYFHIYKLVDKIIVHDEYSKEIMLSLFELKLDKINVIKHGLLKIPRDEKEVNRHSSKYHYLKNKIIFLFIGSINKYKGIDLLIETWNSSSVLNSNDKIHLLIAGNDKDNLLRHMKTFNNVTLIDKYLDNDEFVSFVKLSDVILLPYLKISQSGVLMSVLNEKKRVLVSNIGGLTEPFKYDDIGWVLKKIDVGTLEKSILKIIYEITRNNDTSDFKNINAAYNWSLISEETFQLYVKLLPQTHEVS